MSFTAAVGVLTGTRDTGHNRDYGRNPYVANDQPDRLPLFPQATDDTRLPAQTRVTGIEDDGIATPVAIVRDQLVDAAVIELTIGDTDLVVWHRPGQRPLPARRHLLARLGRVPARYHHQTLTALRDVASRVLCAVRVQAAQQDSLDTSRVNVRAASLRASVMVR